MCTASPQAYNASTWVRSAIRNGDPLSGAIFRNATLRRSFFWVSHTFTHQNLNNATYSDARCGWFVMVVHGMILRLICRSVQSDRAAQ
jgi:hypothetical protein